MIETTMVTRKRGGTEPPDMVTADAFVALVRQLMAQSRVPASAAARTLIVRVTLEPGALLELAADGAARRAANADHDERRLAASVVGDGVERGDASEDDHGIDSSTGNGAGTVERRCGIEARAGRPRPVPGTPLKQKILSILSAVTLYGADGKRKTLLEFTVGDWNALAESSAALAASCRKRAKLAREATALLRARNAETAAALPLREQLQLATLAQEAWSA